jgi:hypothetical protein
MVRCALVLLLAAACLASCGGGSSKPATTTTTAKVSDANRLVDIWKGVHVSPPNADIRAVQEHLVSLSRRCGESEGALASSLAAALRLLAEHSVHPSPVALTALLDAAALQRKSGSSCADLLVALLVELESGHALGPPGVAPSGAP